MNNPSSIYDTIVDGNSIPKNKTAAVAASVGACLNITTEEETAPGVGITSAATSYWTKTKMMIMLPSQEITTQPVRLVGPVLLLLLLAAIILLIILRRRRAYHYVAGSKKKNKGICVDVSREPLSKEEKLLLTPDLLQRNIDPRILDVLPPSGKTFYLLRAYVDDDTKDSNNNKKLLLGITVTFNVYPFVALKNMLGEGNHVGWDISFYYTTSVASEKEKRSQVTAALLTRLASLSVFGGKYFGLVNDDIRDALPLIKHRLYRTDYVAGSMPTRGLTKVEDYISKHKQLSKHLRQFHNAGGCVHRIEGRIVEKSIAEQLAQCVLETYKRHWPTSHHHHMHNYAYNTCLNFFLKCQNAVHIYATIDSDQNVVGSQTYVIHPNRLELSEGGFIGLGKQNYHAYEAIMVNALQYAIEHNLDMGVAYGGIWSDTKDRYTSHQNREPLYSLLVYDQWYKFWLFNDWFIRKFFLSTFNESFGSSHGGKKFVLTSSSSSKSSE